MIYGRPRSTDRDYLPTAPSTATTYIKQTAPDFIIDRLLRITASGGTATTPSMVWMRAAPLPPPYPPGGITVTDFSPEKVNQSDDLAHYKSLNYWSRRRGYETAQSRGFDELLRTEVIAQNGVIINAVLEGTRTNVFTVAERGIKLGPIDTRRPVLVTPSIFRPIVPGIMRALVLECAEEIGMEVDQTNPYHLASSQEMFLTNSVRGIIPVRHGAGFNSKQNEVPGPWTQALQEALARRLWAEPTRGTQA